MLNKALKSCGKMISADIKADVKQEKKRTGSCIYLISYNFPLKYLQKTWNAM